MPANRKSGPANKINYFSNYFVPVIRHIAFKVDHTNQIQKLYLINNPKKFNVGIDDLGAKPCIPHKSLLQ